jgi:hypothetical protein
MKEYRQTFSSRVLNLFSILGTVGFIAVGVWLYTAITGVDFNSHIPVAPTIIICIVSVVITQAINILYPRAVLRVTDKGISFLRRGTAYRVLSFAEYDIDLRIDKGTINFIIPFNTQIIRSTNKSSGQSREYVCNGFSKQSFQELISDVTDRRNTP